MFYRRRQENKNVPRKDQVQIFDDQVRHNKIDNIMLLISVPGWEGGVDGDRQRGAPRHPQPRGGPRVPDGRHLPLLLVGGMGPGQLHLLLLHHHDHHRVLPIVGITEHIIEQDFGQ